MNDQLPKNAFTEDEYLRYTRHLQLDQIGIAGQKKLKQAKVCIVGCGGLGNPVSLYLAAAGVGHLTLIDDDDVELSNLQRQISFNEKDVGKSKALQAQKKLEDLNSSIFVEVKRNRLTTKNAVKLLSGSDLVLDCSDNFNTRFAINSYCKASNITWIYASIFQFSGQCALFSPDDSCYHCLFPTPPTEKLDCNAAGVIGVLPGILGTIQALEALKYLLGLEDGLRDELLLVETLPLSLRKIKLHKDANCPYCFPSTSTKNTIEPKQQSEDKTLINRELESENPNTTKHINSIQFDKLANDKNSLVVDVRNPDEHEAFNIGGINIPMDQLATTNIDESKTLIFYCHSGARSDHALIWANENLNNKSQHALMGGIVAYLRDKN